MSLDKTITDRYNFIKDIKKLFSEVPASYATLIDLSENFHYNHLMVVNATDKDITLKFTNSNITAEYIVPAYSEQTLDEFSHNRIIQYKYTISAPTVGFFKLTSWLGFQN